MKMSGNTILVTGGGSGIGKALAHRFHDLGNTVILAGRRRGALDEAAAGRPGIHVATVDISDAQSIAELAKRVVVEHPSLNVLINNAGTMAYEDLSKGRNLNDAEAMVATNLLGPIRLTNALVDHLSTRDDAAILNVSSALAFVPLASVGTYSATKAAIHSYSMSLRVALKNKVDVIELPPPGVQTDMTVAMARRAAFMSIDLFADQVMDLLSSEPTPPEIIVDNVRGARFADAQGKFEQTFALVNGII